MTALPDTKPWYGVTQKQAYERGLWAAPEGYALVPIEPTPEMQQAGALAVRIDTTVLNKIWTGNAVFRAMVAAAPTHEETNHG